MNTNGNNTLASPYRRGADRGYIFGLWFTAIFLSWIFSSQLPMLSLVTVGLILAMPFLIYRLLRNSSREQGGVVQVSSLWVEGITMVMCGSLICAAVVVIYFKWIDPDYMARQLQLVVDMYASTNDESLAEAARLSKAILDNNAVPSASTWTLAMWLFTVSSGSLLSGLMAVLVKARGGVSRRMPPRQ